MFLRYWSIKELNTMVSSHRFIGALDLIGDSHTWKKFSKKDIENLERGNKSFDWIHLGTTGITLRQFSHALKKFNYSPPRTGHAGNWAAMTEGGAGSLDYNQSICLNNKFGRPLVFDLNQIETTDLSSGDTIYRPGSKVIPSGIFSLPILGWNGLAFSLIERDRPRFVPFMAITEDDNTIISLQHWHRRRNQAEGWNYLFWSDLVIKNIEYVRAILTATIKSIEKENSKILNISNIVDRFITLDGTIHRTTANLMESGVIILGKQHYSSIEAFVEDSLIPFRAASSSQWFIENVTSLPKTIPMVSNMITVALYALLRTHVKTPSLDNTDKIIVHPHWGAIGMAGFPPTRKGYFGTQTRYLRKVVTALIKSNQEIGYSSRSVLYLLAPAAIFLIVPMSHHPEDMPVVEELLATLYEQSSSLDPSEFNFSTVQFIVNSWLDRSHTRLSDYWLQRFQHSRTVGSTVGIDKIGKPIIPSLFMDISFRTLCHTVGAIDEYFGSQL